MESSIFLSAIVAMTKDRVIGDGKRLMWNLPEDLKNLKLITMGSPLIMGRKTWDSIGKPLPGRANIVLTKNVGLILNAGSLNFRLIQKQRKWHKGSVVLFWLWVLSTM